MKESKGVMLINEEAGRVRHKSTKGRKDAVFARVLINLTPFILCF